MPVATGGAMIQRAPNDPRLVQGRAVARQHAAQPAGALVHVVVRRVGRPEPRDVQPRAQDREAGRAPTSSGRSSRRSAHCAFTRATEDTIVGERSMGDARLDYQEIIYGFFDKFLKGDAEHAHRQDAEGDLLHDGAQQVADVGHVAAARRPADDVLPVERRQGQHAQRRRRAGHGAARDRHARRVHLRSDAIR